MEGYKGMFIMGYGGTATCPNCHGTMKLIYPATYRCYDCRGRYQINGTGIADKEVTVQGRWAR